MKGKEIGCLGALETIQKGSQRGVGRHGNEGEANVHEL